MAGINYQGSIYDDTVLFYDMSDPGNPLYTKSLTIAGDIKDLHLTNDRLYLIVATGAGDSSLQIFGISNLNDIVLLTKYDINGMTATHFAIKSGIAAVSATDYGAPYPYKTYLLFLDASDAHNIFPISVTEMNDFYPPHSGSATYGDAQFIGRYLFMSGNDGMKIFDARRCMAGHDRPVSKP